MKEGPLGIYYLDYSPVPYPKSTRKFIIGYTKKEFLDKISDAKIPGDWLCWLSECRTPGYLVEGDINKITAWIKKHIPNKFGEPLNG
jgi:hypothetical protein